jgi:hypothetical protein
MIIGGPYTGSSQAPDPQSMRIGIEGGRFKAAGFVTSDLLPMKLGNVTGKASMISALARARRNARMEMVSLLEQWVLKHVPRSEKPHFHMEDAVLSQLKYQSTDDQIKIGAPGVPYAAYVDAMNPPVNWTKNVPAQNQYHWFKRMIAYSQGLLVPALTRAIQAMGLASGLSAKKVAEVMARG